MTRIHSPIMRALVVLLLPSIVTLGCATPGVRQAARRGDVAELEQYLEAGASPDGPSRRDDRPLHEAAEQGHARSVELLLAHGARIDPRNDRGETPLYLAAKEGRTEVVRILLSAGANPRLADRNGRTPLIVASDDGHGETVLALLEGGAPPDDRDASRRTALWYAVDERDLEAADALLEHGAEANMRDAGDRSLLALAIEQNDREMVRLLLEHGADPLKRTQSGNPPLVEALLRNRADLASLLVESGADPEMASTDDLPPIVIAARMNNTAAVMLLVEANADPDARGRDGETALGWAVEHGNRTLIEYLLGAKADPNAWSRAGRTPLFITVERGHIDIARMLLAAGADADGRTRSGARPMVVAVNRRDDAMIALLAEHGAEPTTAQESMEDMPGFLSQYGYGAVLQAALAAAAEARNAAMGGPRQTETDSKGQDGATPHPAESASDAAPSAGGAASALPNATGPLYSRRVAVVVGIDRYRSWPALEGARRDGRQVAGRLRDMGFDEVIELYDERATRTEILRVLGTELPKLTDSNSMAMIYFAGHGQTETLSGGDKRGYVIPVDAEPDQVFATAISMDTLREISARLPAKQVYYAMDSCYSGLGLARGVSIEPVGGGAFIQKVTSLRAVQMITAGSEGEQALESGGQGLFTRYFLRALEGEADFDDDGFVTASEIGTYVRPQVTMASKRRQTPQFGTLEGSGEVAFPVTPDSGS